MVGRYRKDACNKGSLLILLTKLLRDTSLLGKKREKE